MASFITLASTVKEGSHTAGHREPTFKGSCHLENADRQHSDHQPTLPGKVNVQESPVGEDHLTLSLQARSGGGSSVNRGTLCSDWTDRGLVTGINLTGTKLCSMVIQHTLVQHEDCLNK